MRLTIAERAHMAIRITEYTATTAEADLTVEEARDVLVSSSWMTREDADNSSEQELCDALAEALIDEPGLSPIRSRLESNSENNSFERNVEVR